MLCTEKMKCKKQRVKYINKYFDVEKFDQLLRREYM